MSQWIPIRFKSNDDNFKDEQSDIKNNTVRITDDWTKERWDRYYESTHIIIEHKKTAKTFGREIRHKCTYKNMAIITWIPSRKEA